MTTREPVPDQNTDLKSIVDELAYRYDGTFARETIAEYVESTHAMLAEDATVHAFLPMLTRRFASERLLARAQSQGKVAKASPEVLFLCVHNAGRSQIAAAFLDHLSGGRVHVRSAGSRPTGGINAVVTQAMAEVGIDLTEAFPKPMTDDVVRAADVIVTMGCGDACPIYPGKRYEDWPVADPAGASLEIVRDIRDDIEARVRKLLADLVPAESTVDDTAGVQP